MPAALRLVTTPLLAISLWLITDGVRCLMTGRYFGRLVAPDALARHPDALVLPDGTAIDYGRFGSFLVERGLDPHALAPVFVVIGLVGVAAVVALFLLRPVGYALALTAALGTILRWGAAGAVGAVLALVLALPPVRARFFEACAARLSAPRRDAPPSRP